MDCSKTAAKIAFLFLFFTTICIVFKKIKPPCAFYGKCKAVFWGVVLMFLITGQKNAD
jgi:hypothetical protein